LGILEKTRALLVAMLGSRLEDISADEQALRNLIMDLERAHADIKRGIENLKREEEYLRGLGGEPVPGSRLAAVIADIKEGEQELVRVVAAVDEAQTAFRRAVRAAKAAAKIPPKPVHKKAAPAKKAAKPAKKAKPSKPAKPPRVKATRAAAKPKPKKAARAARPARAAKPARPAKPSPAKAASKSSRAKTSSKARKRK
jgi:outer membrane biosynthesis protein TonB